MMYVSVLSGNSMSFLCVCVGGGGGGRYSLYLVPII